MEEAELTPKQKRSRESQKRILDATLELLEDRHFEDMTIADIAAVAGMAVGNFYKRFKNKESLLPHLYAEYNQRFRAFAQSFQATKPERPWNLVVNKTVAFFAHNRGLIRALHLHSRLNPDLVPDGSNRTRQELYRALEPLIKKKGLDPATRTQRARTAALVMVSAITEAILYPDMTPFAASGLSKKHMVEGLTEILENFSQ